MAFKAEYIWIDGTQPTAKLRSKTRILADGARARRSGASTVPAPTRPRATPRTACLQPVFTCPDPIRGGEQRPGAVRGPEHRRAPRTRATPAPLLRRGRRAVRRSGADLRHRAGVHLLQGRPSARLPGGRLPGPAGRLLLRRRRGRGLRPRRRRGSHGRAASPPAWRSAASTPRSCPASGSSRSARSAPEASDHLWVARWLLYRIAEEFGISATPRAPSRSRATGTVPARTPTSPPRPCARATTRSSPRASRSAPTASRSSTSPATATASRTA